MFMFAAAVLAAPTLTQHRVATLRGWARAGLDLVRRLRVDSGGGRIDAGRALLRAAQAVRLALVLALRLADPDNPLYQPVPAKARAARAAQPKAEPEADPPERPKSPERPERLRPERLRPEPLSDAVILRRPLVEIVRVICKALGVTPDLSLWSDAPPPAPAPAPRLLPRALSEPPPRPRLALERRVAALPGVQRVRLRSTAAPLALIPSAAPARGRLRLSEGLAAALAPSATAR